MQSLFSKFHANSRNGINSLYKHGVKLQGEGEGEGTHESWFLNELAR